MTRKITLKALEAMLGIVLALFIFALFLRPIWLKARFNARISEAHSFVSRIRAIDLLNMPHDRRIDRIVEHLKKDGSEVSVDAQRRIIHVNGSYFFIYPGENANDLIISVTLNDGSRYEGVIAIEANNPEARKWRWGIAR